MSNKQNKKTQDTIDQYGSVDPDRNHRPKKNGWEVHCLRYFLLINQARRDLAKDFTKEELTIILYAIQGGRDPVRRYMFFTNAAVFIGLSGCFMKPQISLDSDVAKTLLEKL